MANDPRDARPGAPVAMPDDDVVSLEPSELGVTTMAETSDGSPLMPDAPKHVGLVLGFVDSKPVIVHLRSKQIVDFLVAQLARAGEAVWANPRDPGGN